MPEITISISAEVLSVVLSAIAILFFIIGISLLSWIKKRVSEDLNKTFVYLIIAVIIAALARVLDVLSNRGILNPIIYELFVIISAFFFLLSLINFYKSIKKAAPKIHHRVHHRVHHRSVRRR